MSSPSLQLDLENALLTFLITQSIPGLSSANVYPAHAKQKIAIDTKGTYLGIIAAVPNWELLTVNATVKVTFEFATADMQDHGAAPAQSVAHALRTGQFIELFSWQSFENTRIGLNASSSGIGFTGWQALPPEPDGMSVDGTQIITKLAYTFEVYLTS